MRLRKPRGVIITLTSQSPNAPVHTLHLSKMVVRGINMSMLMVLVTAVVVGAWSARRYYEQRLANVRWELEAEIARQSSLQQLTESKATTLQAIVDGLNDEVGSVGGFVYEVRKLAGLEEEGLQLPVASERPTFGFGAGGAATNLPPSSADLWLDQSNTYRASVLSDIGRLKRQLSRLKNDLVYQQELAEATPKVWPVRGWISSAYGWRPSPFNGRGQFHKGMDIVGPFKAPVLASAPGQVVIAEYNRTYGYYVVVDHGFGYTTVYAHLNSIAVEVGDEVAGNDVVGTLGTSGYSTGPHVHYEVRIDGVAVDPAFYMD